MSFQAVKPVLGAIALLAYLASPANADVNLTPAQNASGAGTLSPIISPSYTGFGIEPSNVMAYTGTTTVNSLTYNLMANLANYTGAPPHLRIGGNAGDNMLYSSSVTSYQLQNNPNSNGLGTQAASDYYLFGPNYFKAIGQLPAGTPVTYGLNLAYQGSDAVQQMVNTAEAAFSNIGDNINIVSLEIGNEPDLYIDLGYRPSTWTVNDFGNEWATRAQAIYTQVLQPRNLSSNFFEPATTATTATKTGQAFRIANLVNTGVATQNGIFVAGWNQHDYYYYVNVSNYQLTLSNLLDLSTTTNQFKEWSDQAQQAIVTGKPYYLREMGSVGPNGIAGISDTFGNALWTLNFFFFAATVQVSAVQMHMTQYSEGSPWLPITLNGESPHVRPSYYAWAAFDQVVGASCNTRIAQVSLSNTPSNYQNRLVAYGAYRGNALTSIVMINTNLYYANSGYASYQNFVVSLPGWAGRTVYLSMMTAPGVDSTSGATWNGLSYEQSGNGTPTTANSTQWTMVVGSDGTLSVPVRDSQAVVVSSFRLGRESVNTANCQTLAASNTDAGGASSGTTSGTTAPTFKSTSGFKSSMPLSLGAIIAIAAGGGVFLLALLGLFIFCCVRSCKKKNRRKARLGAMGAPPRHDDHPLLHRDSPEDLSHASYPTYHNHSPHVRGWDSPMTSASHNHHVQPSQQFVTMRPDYDWVPTHSQHGHEQPAYHAPQSYHSHQAYHSPQPHYTQPGRAF